MKKRGMDWLALGTAMSQLYGYIFCMLVSNALTGMPLFGGALYLCGRMILVYGNIYRRVNRRFLPGYIRKCGPALAALNAVLAVLLIGLYPASFESASLWVIFAMAALNLAVDAASGRAFRLTGRLSGRGRIVLVTVQLLLTGAAAWVLVANLGSFPGWLLTAGFTLRTLIQLYSDASAARGQEPEELDAEQPDDVRTLPAYRSFEWVSVLLVMAVEMTSVVIYALLATNISSLAAAMAVGVGCTILGVEAGVLFLRRTEKKKHRDPTWLLCIGMVFWLYGVADCSRMLLQGQVRYGLVFLTLGLCAMGSSLSLTGLNRMEALMPEVARAVGKPMPESYAFIRNTSQEFARLLGDSLALIALTVFCFATGKDLPRDMEALSARFQPLMMVPLTLVGIVALLAVLRFPIGERTIERIRRFLQQREATGEDNPALRRQVEEAVTGRYRQPFLAGMLKAVLRPFYRHRLVNADRIREDERNPIVFLCNHGEIYGPVVCELYMPVAIHSWAISMMMTDRKEVSDYLYENTFQPVHWLPNLLGRKLSDFLGWMSVTVMHQVEAIPVYRDQPIKLRETIRASIEALQAGENILIFPELPEGKYPKEGIAPLSPGFVMLAAAYWRRTGKRMRILPMYANRARRTISFGEEIVFDPDVPFPQEQERVVKAAETQMRNMAEEL